MVSYSRKVLKHRVLYTLTQYMASSGAKYSLNIASYHPKLLKPIHYLNALRNLFNILIYLVLLGVPSTGSKYTGFYPKFVLCTISFKTDSIRNGKVSRNQERPNLKCLGTFSFKLNHQNLA